MAAESRKKYLAKNTAIFAFGNLGTKFISFFLVPFYTYTLTTEEYGTIDLIISITSIFIPIIMCNIHEAVRRYLLDPEPDEKAIRAVEFIWVAIGFGLSLLLYAIFSVIPAYNDYAVEIAAYTFASATIHVMQDYLRGIEKLKCYAFLSILSTLIVALLNILFLAKLGFGVKGYLWAYIIAYSVTSVVGFIMGKQYEQMREIHFDVTLFRRMSYFSIMLVPNSIMWWITNSSDRIMVTYMVSAATNGIYSISYKLPSLMSVFNTILMQAWQYSAIKESESQDKESYNNRMYVFYCTSMAIIAVVLILILKPFMKLYVAADYYTAWMYSPFLIAGMMFQTLGTFVGTSYYVEKDVKGNLISSAVGAGVNVVLNLMLIPVLGASGAAMATCTSYIVVLIYRLINTRKFITIRAFTPYTIRLYILVVLMIAFVYLPGIYCYLFMIIDLGIVLYLTRNEMIKPVLETAKSMMRKIKH